MGNNIYKHIEITGTSSKSIDDAIQNAIMRAAATVRKMQWFKMVEIRGRIEGDKVGQWQVTIKVAFTLEE